MGDRRAMGYRPDPPYAVKRRAKFGALKLSAASLPLSTNNRQCVDESQGGPGIQNQGQISGCTGFGVGDSITTRFALLGKPIPPVSEIGVYTVGRSIDTVPNRDGTLPPLVDEGAEPSQVIRGIQQWGVCSRTKYGNWPPDPSTVNSRVTLTDLEAMAHFRLDNAYFIESTGNQKIVDVITALANKYPVTNAIAASGEAFNDYSGGLLTAEMLTGDTDHYNYLIDYTWDGTNPNSVVVYGVNSWGPEWGDSGFYRLDVSALLAQQDMAVMDVVPASPAMVEE